MSDRPAGGSSEEEPPVVIRDNRKVSMHGDLPRQTAEAPQAAAPDTSEADTKLAERTADLQRLQAEYANYRKRVDRDRELIGEVATARVLEALLPVLDDVDRAAAHGDVTGAFKAVTDQLTATLGRLGLTSFGDVGDPFDPAIHEAVMHDTSPEVTEPTATVVMRRGYKAGERMLRPAMVGVSDPADAGSAGSADEPGDSS